MTLAINIPLASNSALSWFFAKIWYLSRICKCFCPYTAF